MTCRAVSRLMLGAGWCCLASLVPFDLVTADETPPIGFEALLGFDALPLLVDWPAYQD